MEGCATEERCEGREGVENVKLASYGERTTPYKTIEKIEEIHFPKADHLWLQHFKFPHGMPTESICKHSF